MKKIIIIFFISILSTIDIAAQTPSLANIQTLWKKQRLSDISTQLRTWGFKLINAEPESDTKTYAGVAVWVSNIYYNNYKESWDSKNAKAVTSVGVKESCDVPIAIIWKYQSSATHNAIKSQIKNAGWKYSKEDLADDEIVVYYTNQNSEQIIELRESAEKGYTFWYRLKNEDDN